MCVVINEARDTDNADATGTSSCGLESVVRQRWLGPGWLLGAKRMLNARTTSSPAVQGRLVAERAANPALGAMKSLVGSTS